MKIQKTCYQKRKENKMKLSNIEIDYHRNGGAGEGFHVAMFDMEEDGQKQRMFAVIFRDAGYCAVFDVNLLAKGTFKFVENSWRCEHFEDELRKAVQERRDGLKNTISRI